MSTTNDFPHEARSLDESIHAARAVYLFDLQRPEWLLLVDACYDYPDDVTEVRLSVDSTDGHAVSTLRERVRHLRKFTLPAGEPASRA
jgi:hypothetical protein